MRSTDSHFIQRASLRSHSGQPLMSLSIIEMRREAWQQGPISHKRRVRIVLKESKPKCKTRFTNQQVKLALCLILPRSLPPDARKVVKELFSLK